ncbi:DUF1707 domain-containing protein [Herbidospora sp. NEAU-GS84]|uniref:DUF1707 domain-containing protein n=1 Tax=Herbidospora solisilvae TaxID=2696284 RepID=A0A7C9N657_9ACTN|nr:DUF1707 domain-containing protein [Herbidospora solisilvae]NAS21693.1 DUF1707 domain-containing protein [Herbidospora solisilvae]
MTEPAGMRASDSEREAVVERLRVASTEGRLTLAELTDRTEAAYLAQTQGELAQLTADLPGGAAAPSYAPAKPPGKARQWFVAVMGDTKRKGKWRVDNEIGAVAVMGDVTIDLREAEVRSNEIDIVATCVMGDIKIIVPDGVDVQLSGVTIMGDKKVKVVEAPVGQHAPIVRVRGYVVMGDIKILGDSHAAPIRRNALAWTEWWLHRRGLGHGSVHRAVNQAVNDSIRETNRMVNESIREAVHESKRAWKHRDR